MNSKINVNRENVYAIVNNLKYGTTTVGCNSEETRLMLESAIDIVNDVFGAGMVRIKPSVDTKIVNEEFPIENCFDLICSWNSAEIGFNLGGDDFNFMAKAFNARNGKLLVEVKINEAVYKLAKKQAYKIGVKFIIDNGKAYFDGREKQKPIYQRIQDAYKAGDEIIEFRLDEASIPTVRCYASSFGQSIGEKFSCSIVEGKTVIRFRPMDQDSKLREEIKLFFNRSISEFGKEKAIKFAYDFYNELMWKSDAEATEPPVSSEPNTREVDGMQQFYMKELEEPAVSNFEEYDDF